MRIKQSICYPCFKPDNVSLGDLFEAAAKIGYAAIELWARGDDFEEVMALAKRSGLAVASMSGHKSLPDGLNKRFYPVGMKIEKGQADNIQTLILEKIADRPYISQKELAEDMGLDVSTINYHVNMMAGAGLILSEKKGRTKRYYVSPDIEGVEEVTEET